MCVCVCVCVCVNAHVFMDVCVFCYLLCFHRELIIAVECGRGRESGKERDWVTE